MAGCIANQVVLPAFGTYGQLGCSLPEGHDGGLHFDAELLLWWMRALPAQRPEDIPACVRLNENLPAPLQAVWRP